MEFSIIELTIDKYNLIFSSKVYLKCHLRLDKLPGYKSDSIFLSNAYASSFDINNNKIEAILTRQGQYSIFGTTPFKTHKSSFNACTPCSFK